VPDKEKHRSKHQKITINKIQDKRREMLWFLFRIICFAAFFTTIGFALLRQTGKYRTDQISCSERTLQNWFL